MGDFHTQKGTRFGQPSLQCGKPGGCKGSMPLYVAAFQVKEAQAGRGDFPTCRVCEASGTARRYKVPPGTPLAKPGGKPRGEKAPPAKAQPDLKKELEALKKENKKLREGKEGGASGPDNQEAKSNKQKLLDLEASCKLLKGCGEPTAHLEAKAADLRALLKEKPTNPTLETLLAECNKAEAKWTQLSDQVDKAQQKLDDTKERFKGAAAELYKAQKARDKAMAEAITAAPPVFKPSLFPAPLEAGPHLKEWDANTAAFNQKEEKLQEELLAKARAEREQREKAFRDEMHQKLVATNAAATAAAAAAPVPQDPWPSPMDDTSDSEAALAAKTRKLADGSASPGESAPSAEDVESQRAAKLAQRKNEMLKAEAAEEAARLNAAGA